MALLEDVVPLLIGSRIFGCAPHRINDRDILVTKWGLAYSLILSLIFLYAFVAGLYLMSVDVMEIKILMLTGMRTVLSYVCFFTDAILTMIWNDKLRNSIAHIHEYDLITRYSRKINSRILLRCRLALCTVVVFWCLMGFVTYRCERTAPLFHGITYGIVNAAISMQILKFTAFLTLLCRRFCHLESLILPGKGQLHEKIYGQKCKEVLWMTQQSQRYQIHDVWWLHSLLSNSAEEINSVYTIQLLFWIATTFLNALSRIYALTESYGSVSFYKIRETMALIACLANLLIITVMCHLTAVKDNVEVGMYFHLRKLNFFAGAGFIRIDLPLLMSIGGAMTTYLVILHALNNNQ